MPADYRGDGYHPEASVGNCPMPRYDFKPQPDKQHNAAQIRVVKQSNVMHLINHVSSKAKESALF